MGEDRALLQRYRDELPALLIVSQVELEEGPEGEVLSTSASAALEAEVRRALGRRCERCWNHAESVGAGADFPSLCHRCLPTVRRLLASA
jgi:isoleucyl-tRNA synthetase